MTQTKVYIFSGKFKNLDEACLYSEPQWAPEPDASASDQEYREWEDNNPEHKLKNNIGAYLDEDYIETIEVDYHYLTSLNISDDAIARIKSSAKQDNILVLVYEPALGGFALENEPASNTVLNYCGVYSCIL